MSNRPFYCSPRAHHSLTEQMTDLGVQRVEILERIEAAAGDSINPEENLAKEQARRDLEFLDTRIAALGTRLADAVVVDASGSDHVVVGSTVALDFGDGIEEFLVGHIVESAECDVVSPDSPLGSALLGSAAGDTVTWRTPDQVALSAVVRAVT